MKILLYIMPVAAITFAGYFIGSSKTSTPNPTSKEVQESCIPFELDTRGHIIVDGTIENGIKVKWLLDTGSTVNVLPKSLYESLPGYYFAMPILASGSSGKSWHKLITLDSIRVGKKEKKREKALVVPEESEINGTPVLTLGSSFFNNENLQIDHKNNEACFFSHSAQIDTSGSNQSVPLEIYDGLPFINVKINGINAKAFLDLGSVNNMVFINEHLLNKANLEIIDNKHAALISFNGEATALKIYSLNEFSIENIKYDVTEAAHNKRSNYSEQLIGKSVPAIRLSLSNLKEIEKFLLDYQDKKLYIWRHNSKQDEDIDPQ